jgi:hypothetical protein
MGQELGARRAASVYERRSVRCALGAPRFNGTYVTNETDP